MSKQIKIVLADLRNLTIWTKESAFEVVQITNSIMLTVGETISEQRAKELCQSSKFNVTIQAKKR